MVAFFDLSLGKSFHNIAPSKIYFSQSLSVRGRTNVNLVEKPLRSLFVVFIRGISFDAKYSRFTVDCFEPCKSLHLWDVQGCCCHPQQSLKDEKFFVFITAWVVYTSKCLRTLIENNSLLEIPLVTRIFTSNWSNMKSLTRLRADGKTRLVQPAGSEHFGRNLVGHSTISFQFIQHFVIFICATNDGLQLAFYCAGSHAICGQVGVYKTFTMSLLFHAADSYPTHPTAPKHTTWG